MGKAFLFAALFLSLASFGQSKDTVTMVHISIPLEQYKQLLYAIDVNVDSKKASKEIIDFLQKSAQLVQPAEKPKDAPKPKQ